MLIVLLTCGVSAHADEAGRSPQFVNLAPIAFRPVYHGAHFAIDEIGLGRLCSTSGSGYFVAPLQLDEPAVIERVTAFVQDKSAESFALVSLVRHTPRKSELLAATPVSAGQSDLDTLSTNQIRAPVIDNQRYSYVLQLVLTGPDVCLYGAQVQYHEP